MLEINKIIRIYENNKLLITRYKYNDSYSGPVKIMIEYEDFKKYIFMDKWDNFFMIYKKIKKDNNYINFYEVIENKCKF